MRLVEYCPFPRADLTHGRRLGSTRDVSPSGMGLESEAGCPVGSLLRLTLRSIDGRPATDALARVAWCEEHPGGGARLGLSLIAQAPAEHAGVRPSRRKKARPAA